ncbi:helix-turn-helix transcriptional regulator [Pectobacterium colocasium]|uniref:helix-turn-helix transcriptional regulator n=1 Tax=Pectobacteriaceae TaxID=1903410 RepID=UPI00027E103E|nr:MULTISPECIES: AlpA family phage regulatory protein [Pectobacteriaceae]WED68817.1 AlpA family phage regulatory protein [Pectobacterium colocasium]GKW00211.1 hypothetical protein PEC301653_32560 [Pectobacterium carotovorum subsp. carotovorum]AFR03576.1 transcriptional regulator, putative [Pectobacterium carotovorum subsp. carotovorum PCC21]KFF62603.1 transcriptional regulator [Pectobacterium brasiliense]MCL6358133.1 AlpA family phage regulatory protein [Pectobacterium parmentieri]
MNNNQRILRKKEVLSRTGISNATLYRLIAKELFPAQRKLTGAEGRAVGWLDSDINDWISSRGQTL